MCSFFSCVSDGAGKIMYLEGEARKKEQTPDSHTTIAHVHGFIGRDEDMLNKYEYDPITQELVVDQMNNKNDSELVLEALKGLDFHKIAPVEMAALEERKKEEEKERLLEIKAQEARDEDNKREINVGDVCRFRTKKEFEEVFGERWQRIVQYTWCIGGMDYLFGERFVVRSIENGGNGKNLYHSTTKIEEGWSISKNMLVKVE